VDLLYGARYAASVDAARFLVVGSVVEFFSYLCFVSLLAVGRNRPYAIGGIVGLVVNVALNLALIPNYSFEGSAVATVITEVFVCALLVTALRRTRGVVSMPWRVAGAVAVAAAGMTGTYLVANLVAPWPVAGALAVGVFLAVLHVLGAEEPGGLRAFVRMVRFDARVDDGGLPASETTL
jgi:O-antigen/teichoic acid export membrane protein